VAVQAPRSTLVTPQVETILVMIDPHVGFNGINFVHQE